MQSTVRIQYVDALLGSDHSKINNKEDKRRERERERERRKRKKEKERERKRKKEKEREIQTSQHVSTSLQMLFSRTPHTARTHRLII